MSNPLHNAMNVAECELARVANILFSSEPGLKTYTLPLINTGKYALTVKVLLEFV